MPICLGLCGQFEVCWDSFTTKTQQPRCNCCEWFSFSALHCSRPLVSLLVSDSVILYSNQKTYSLQSSYSTGNVALYTILYSKYMSHYCSILHTCHGSLEPHGASIIVRWARRGALNASSTSSRRVARRRRTRSWPLGIQRRPALALEVVATPASCVCR